MPSRKLCLILQERLMCSNFVLCISLNIFTWFCFSDTSGSYYYDSKAFLFSFVNNPGWAPLKLPQTGKRSSSIRCHSTLGPTFGGGYDICIYNNAPSNSNSYSNLGYTYSSPSGYNYGSTFAQTFLAGTHRFTPDEVETFYKTT